MGFSISIVALVLGESLSIAYSKLFSHRTFAILREDVPDGHIRLSFTPSAFEKNLQAIIVSVTGIPTLLLTVTAIDDSPVVSRFTIHGILTVAIAVLGTILLGSYGLSQARPTIEGWRILWLSVPTFLLLVLNGAALFAIAFDRLK